MQSKRKNGESKTPYKYFIEAAYAVTLRFAFSFHDPERE